MRKWQNDKNSSTRSPTPVSLLSNKPVSPTHRSVRDHHSRYITCSLKWRLVAPATIMGSHEVPAVAQIGTRKVGILAVDSTLITRVVEVKVAGVTTVALIHHKAVGPLIPRVVFLEQVVLVEVVAAVGLME